MAFKAANIVRQELTTNVITNAAALVYTSPNNVGDKKITEIRNITICNNNASTAQVSLHIIDGAAAADSDNRVIAEGTPDQITSKDRLEISTWKVLAPGDTIRARATQTDVTIHIDGATVDSQE